MYFLLKGMGKAMETLKNENLSVCGTDCSACYCYGNMCIGCNECEGKVFHAPDGQACAIYDCTVHNKKKKN